MLDQVQLDIDPGTEAALEKLARAEWIHEELIAQTTIDRMGREFREAKRLDGLGDLTRRVPTFAYHDWAKKLGSYACWRDKGFTKYFDRIAPECLVKAQSAKTMVGYRAIPGQVVAMGSGATRFHKVYENR